MEHQYLDSSLMALLMQKVTLSAPCDKYEHDVIVKVSGVHIHELFNPCSVAPRFVQPLIANRCQSILWRVGCALQAVSLPAAAVREELSIDPYGELESYVQALRNRLSELAKPTSDHADEAVLIKGLRSFQTNNVWISACIAALLPKCSRKLQSALRSACSMSHETIRAPIMLALSKGDKNSRQCAMECLLDPQLAPIVREKVLLNLAAPPAGFPTEAIRLTIAEDSGIHQEWRWSDCKKLSDSRIGVVVAVVSKSDCSKE